MFICQIQAVQSVLAPELCGFLSTLFIHGPGPQYIHQPCLLLPPAFLFTLRHAVHHRSPLFVQGFQLR